MKTTREFAKFLDTASFQELLELENTRWYSEQEVANAILNSDDPYDALTILDINLEIAEFRQKTHFHRAFGKTYCGFDIEDRVELWHYVTNNAVDVTCKDCKEASK